MLLDLLSSDAYLNWMTKSYYSGPKHKSQFQ